MSVKFGGIDLNSMGDSVEANNEAGVDNGFENEILKKIHCDPCGAGGVSIYGARVLGEAIDSAMVSGLVNDQLKSEMDAAVTDESLKAEKDGVNKVSEVKEGNSEIKEGVFGLETLENDYHLGMDVIKIGNGEVEAKIEKDQNQRVGVSAFPQHAQDREKVSLVVDLNALHVAHGDVMPDNGTDNEGFPVKQGFIELNLPFSVPSAENEEPIKEAYLSGSQNFLIEHQMNNEQLVYMDGKGVNHDALIPKSRVREIQTEKEGEFYVSDLVWAKVRSHPWWPGQIFEPSSASEKAMKYFKKDSYLIAYFGDQTFAWNEASKIKPFRMYFSQMEKQSNVEAFSHAVDGALDEVSRRVEIGLACGCLPEGEIAKVKSQLIVNAGIQEQSSRIDGGDSFSTAASIIPANLVNCLKSLAEAPKVSFDKLEFATARGQFLAFNRWKGNYQLPVFAEIDGILESDADPPVLEEKKISSNEAIEGVSGSDEDDPVTGKAKSATQDGSRKRKHLTLDNQCKKKKMKPMLELMSGSSSSLSNGQKKFEEKASRKLDSVSPNKKLRAVDAISSESRVKKRDRLSLQMATNKASSLSRNHIEVGEHLRRVGGKLARSQKAISEHGEKSLNTSGVSPSSTGRCDTPPEYPPTDEMLSKLVIASENPMDYYSSLTSVASFLLEFRNFICLERKNTFQEKKSSGRQKPEMSSELETSEALKFEGIEDSYWTDRIIQSSLDEQVLFELETQDVKDTTFVEPEAVEGMDANADNNHEINALVTEQEAGNPSEIVDGKSEYSPTALILHFTDLESVPSITNLNNIFNRYGPLNESETEVFSKSKRAKVVFKWRSDAETAFSSTGKFSIFGPSLVSYRLKYLPTLRKAPTASKAKRRRKNTTSAEQSAM